MGNLIAQDQLKLEEIAPTPDYLRMIPLNERLEEEIFRSNFVLEKGESAAVQEYAKSWLVDLREFQQELQNQDWKDSESFANANFLKSESNFGTDSGKELETQYLVAGIKNIQSMVEWMEQEIQTHESADTNSWMANRLVILYEQLERAINLFNDWK